MRIRKISDITNLRGEEMLKLTKEELVYAIKRANTWANKRLERAIPVFQKKIENDPNYPIPQVYREDSRRGGAIEERAKYKRFIEGSGTDARFVDPLKREGDYSISLLRSQFTRVRDFLSTKTSTVEGWENVLDNWVKKLSKETGVEIRRKDYSKFWKVYNMVEETIPEETVQGGRYELWRKVATAVTDRDYSNLSPTELATKLENDIFESYGREWQEIDEDDW